MKICPQCSELHTDAGGFCTACGAPLVKSTDRLLGRTIAARYRLIRRLGEGGMSQVYLARHVMIDRLSALKILRRDLCFDPQQRERFLREARAVNRINHPNIVEITDYGEADDLAYLVMEYVAGDSVLGHLRGGPFPWERAVGVAIKVAAALARAHQLGVIHRDLKPENVLLVPHEGGDEVKLTDFGIAKILDAPTLTFSEQMFGTPGYIAPEYIEGAQPDGRSDLYALGVLVYEMLTRALPYDGRGEADLLLQPLTKDPVPPSRRVDGIPYDLEMLVLRLLARKPEGRPRDAFEAHDAFAAILGRTARLSFTPVAPTLYDTMHVAVRPAPVTDTGGVPFALGPTDVALRAPAVDFGARHTLQAASQWAAAVGELAVRVDRARSELLARTPSSSASGALAAATALVATARDLVTRLDRTTRVVAESQARVDALDAEAREFRARLGHALDVLVQDRSRLRADAADADEHEPSEPARDDDLTFQIEALEAQLDRRNEAHHAELQTAAGALEGALAAHRRITAEISASLDEATALTLSASSPATAQPA